MSTAAASTLLAAALSCPPAPVPAGAPVPAVFVVAEHHTPAMGAAYALDELRSFASKAGHAGPHPVLGFYLATFGYRIEPAGPCPGPAVIRLLLQGRQVEVPSDAAAWGCRQDRLAAHYLSHARADDAALDRLAQRLLASLDRAHERDNERPAAALLAATIEGLLPAYDADRARALASPDAGPELDQLREACRGGEPGSL